MDGAEFMRRTVGIIRECLQDVGEWDCGRVAEVGWAAKCRLSKGGVAVVCRDGGLIGRVSADLVMSVDGQVSRFGMCLTHLCRRIELLEECERGGINGDLPLSPELGSCIVKDLGRCKRCDIPGVA